MYGQEATPREGRRKRERLLTGQCPRLGKPKAQKPPKVATSIYLRITMKKCLSEAGILSLDGDLRDLQSSVVANYVNFF